MKEIYLIRHGKVDVQDNIPIHSKVLKDWVKSYDSAPLDRGSQPGDLVYDIIQDVDIVITSEQKRAIDSAKLLDVSISERNKFFNEAKIPDASLPFIKLKPKTWLALLRAIMFMGYGQHDSSLKASKQQAFMGANRLIELQKEYDRIALIGHGGMNWLISKELQKHGWRAEGKPMHQNWGVTKLVLKMV